MSPSTYTHQQEIWTEDQCRKAASRKRGTPYKGLIAGSASSRPEYGQTVRYNGGFIAPDGEWYQSEHRPLPVIPPTYEFYKIVSWGTYIRKKSTSNS